MSVSLWSQVSFSCYNSILWFFFGHTINTQRHTHYKDSKLCFKRFCSFNFIYLYIFLYTNGMLWQINWILKKTKTKTKQTNRKIMIILACLWSTLGWVCASRRNSVNIHLSHITNHTLNTQESLHDFKHTRTYPKAPLCLTPATQAWPHQVSSHNWSYVGGNCIDKCTEQVETDSHQSNWIELGSDPKPSCIDKHQWEYE